MGLKYFLMIEPLRIIKLFYHIFGLKNLVVIA